MFEKHPLLHTFNVFWSNEGVELTLITIPVTPAIYNSQSVHITQQQLWKMSIKSKKNDTCW